MRKALFLLLFFGSIAVAEPIVPEGGIITNVVSTFYFYDTNEELLAAIPINQRDLLPENPDEVLHGYSYCHRDLEKNFAVCEIHQVLPTVVDDEQTITLGHEVAHGVFGIYHK